MNDRPSSAVRARFHPVTRHVAHDLRAAGRLRGVSVTIADHDLRVALAGPLAELGARLVEDGDSGPLSDAARFRRAVSASPSLAAAEAAVWAEVVLRHFARRTNLLLSSTETLVVGAGPVSARLRDALPTVGARLSAPSASAAGVVDPTTTLVFGTLEGHPPLGPASARGAGRHPLVLVDAGRSGSAIDRAAFASVDRIPAREGIEGFRLDRDVFVLDRPDASSPALSGTIADLTTAFALASLSAWDTGHADVDGAFATAERTLSEEVVR